MKYKIYRERQLPGGVISCSVMAVFPDGTMSHEEITVDPTSEITVPRSVREELKARWQARGSQRLSPEARGRRREYRELDADEQEGPDA